MRILIIDDDKVDRSTLKKDITNTNIGCVVAEEDSGISGINRFKKETFDCVLLDYYLPDKNGDEILYELKNVAGEFFPIIAITGNASETLPDLMIKAGAIDYLIKDEINARSLEKSLRFVLFLKKQKEFYEKKLIVLKNRSKYFQ